MNLIYVFMHFEIYLCTKSSLKGAPKECFNKILNHSCLLKILKKNKSYRCVIKFIISDLLYMFFALYVLLIIWGDIFQFFLYLICILNLWCVPLVTLLKSISRVELFFPLCVIQELNISFLIVFMSWFGCISCLVYVLHVLSVCNRHIKIVNFSSSEVEWLS